MTDRSEAALMPTPSDWAAVSEAASRAVPSSGSETGHDCNDPSHSIDSSHILKVSTEFPPIPSSRPFPLAVCPGLGLSSRSTFSEPCGLQINAHDAMSKAKAPSKQTLENGREETVSRTLVEHHQRSCCPFSEIKAKETYGGDTSKQEIEPHVEGRKVEECGPKCGERPFLAAQRNECCLKSTPHSPARFLECCLAAEQGVKVSFAYPYLKNQPEVFVGGRGTDQNAGDSVVLMEGSSLRTPNNGAQPCSCSLTTGGDNNLNMEGSLLSSKIYHGKYGDLRVSDSGIHTEGDCCRICQEDGTYEKLISPCYCSGTVGFMHLSCLETWLGLNGRTACELCLFPFPVVKIRPSIWQFFKRPLVNMDFASLLCDVACFCVLTPLLIASTYLCSMGVSHYEEVGKTGSVFAIVTLMVSLIAVYISWAILAVLYHRRVFMTWRERTARIRMWTDKASSPTPSKMPDANDDSISTTNSRLGSFASRRLSGTSILLKPILWYSGSLRSQRNTSRTPFDQDVNSNRHKNTQAERNYYMNKTIGKTQRTRARQPCSCCSSLRPDLKLCPFLSKATLPPLPSCLDVHSQKASAENAAEYTAIMNP